MVYRKGVVFITIPFRSTGNMKGREFMAFVKLNNIAMPALVVGENIEAGINFFYFKKGEKTRIPRIPGQLSWWGNILSNASVAGNFIAFDCKTRNGETIDFNIDTHTVLRFVIGVDTQHSHLKILYDGVETYSQVIYDSSGYGYYFAVVPYVINPSFEITDGSTKKSMGFSFIGFNDYSGTNESFGQFLLNCDAVINNCVGKPNNDGMFANTGTENGSISGCLFRSSVGFSYTDYPGTWNNEINNDPYSPGGESGTGGGTGDFSGTGDDIEIPNLPTLSAVDTSFITLFNPTIGQLHDLANYMWSDLFDLNAWKKIFADPMDAILGMSIVPVNVPAGATTPVTVGNISTGVSMTRAASQFVSVDCGTLNVKEFWGAYLDYDPYTKAEIYLPYIGTHALAVDDIMNKSVHVVYHVDILSGACCAYVKCGGSVLYTFVGQCSCSIPITGNDWTNVINGALSIATAIGSMVATGGASAPLAVASVTSTAVNSMKPNIEKSGSLGGMGGMMGIQTPYLILTRPRQALPKDQNTFLGYPSFMTSKLSGLSGYTEIESIHLENVPATEQELSEIETLLKGGVIL